MILEIFPSGPLATNAYVVACPDTKQAAIIDPGLESASSIQAFIKEKQLTPQCILLTHSHWDHIGNAAELKEAYKVPLYVHADDAANVRDPGADGLPLWVAIEGVEPDHFFEDGDKITVGNLILSVIHTPGHSPGCVCFYDQAGGILLSGDTLFKHSIGILSIPTGRSDQMWPSLKKLSRLPPETKVYPGHGSSTTIGAEKWLPDAERLFG